MAIFNVGDKVWLANGYPELRVLIEGFGLDCDKPFRVLISDDSHGDVMVSQYGKNITVDRICLFKEDPSLKVVDGDISGEYILSAFAPFVSVDNLRRANKWIGIDPAELERLIELAGELK